MIDNALRILTEVKAASEELAEDQPEVTLGLSRELKTESRARGAFRQPSQPAARSLAPRRRTRPCGGGTATRGALRFRVPRRPRADAANRRPVAVLRPDSSSAPPRPHAPDHRGRHRRDRDREGSTPEVLELIRHDAAHALAEAAKELYPDVQVTTGPAIEDGFTYDFARDEPSTPVDLEAMGRIRAVLGPQPGRPVLRVHQVHR